MKKILIPAITLVAGVFIAVGAAKDPVLMEINGKKVPLSEFVYLYEKNNKQQQQPQTIDEYLEMFINYKLKVADAEAAGIDTTAAFRRDMEANVVDVSAPYMRNTELEEEIINTISGNSTRNIDVSHIMLPLGDTPEQTKQMLARADSLRSLILNGADFGELALAYSIDPTVSQNKGHLGWITTNRWPYPFEKVAFSTPLGEISEPFVDSPFGVHIIEVTAERPDPGEVHAQHILKLTANPRVTDQAERDSIDRVAKAQIDSIYELLKAGADFSTIASANSDDPGTVSRGGDLGFFGTGRMVPEFEQVAFALKDGETSQPFKTSYGYHIVKRIEGRQSKTDEELRQMVNARMSRDQALSELLAESVIEKNRTIAGGTLDSKGLEKVRQIIDKAGGLDSATFVTLAKTKVAVAKVGKKKITAAQVAAAMPQQPVEGEAAFNLFEVYATQEMDKEVASFMRQKLYDENAEYRNLVNEYHDGNLLFDISNREVWDRSTKDTQGLEDYFQANKDKYTWTVPHYKGYVVLVANDSIAGDVKNFLETNTIATDSLQKVLRDKFGRHVRIDRVIGGKGENAIVDFIAFDGPRPDGKGFWKSWFGYKGRVITEPEEALDVRARVSGDYQQYLEKQWLDKLHKKYKVKINQAVLDSLRK